MDNGVPLLVILIYAIAAYTAISLVEAHKHGSAYEQEEVQ